ncbi:hypothetical protein QTP86_009902 [Hemibagrus guttatus]|nr:hypothetical protein QTP86_009902 [Hemibagrus guttatus]
MCVVRQSTPPCRRLMAMAGLTQAVTDNLGAFLDAKFAWFESTINSIATRLEKNTKRITEAENHISQTEDKVAELYNKITVLEKSVQSLTERVEDTENRSRRDNIQIIGCPDRFLVSSRASHIRHAPLDEDLRPAGETISHSWLGIPSGGDGDFGQG